MPSNAVVVNGSKELYWEVGDSKIGQVIELLDSVGYRPNAEKFSGAEAGEAEPKN